jgi:hypothetical protein
MRMIASAVLAALALAGPVPAVAAGADSGAKPSSYAPRPQTGPHIYGSPIGPPIVGHAAPAHHSRAHRRQAAATTTRRRHAAPTHLAEPTAPLYARGSRPVPD